MADAGFDPAALLETATKLTGLDDFGDAWFREPFERLVASLAGEAKLNAAGRAAQQQRILDILVTRARAQAWFERHPEILEERITAPLVIVGLPRTGTTLLHRVIAADPGFDCAKWYECRFPAPPEDWDWVSPDPRLAVAEREIAQMLEVVPELASVHPFDPVGPDEEVMLLEQAFLSLTAESYADIPTFGAWRAQQDQSHSYAYLKRMLQFLQWQHRRLGRARDRWVLKAPQHLAYMPQLFATFPDATVVQTHRDPVQSIPSICSMVHHLWELGADAPDPRAAGAQWSKIFIDGLLACMAFRDVGHDDRFFDVWFLDSVKDPLGVVRRIYAFLDRPLTPLAEDQMRRWTQDNAREKRPAHEYSLEKFGLSEEGIRGPLADYVERFVRGR